MSFPIDELFLATMQDLKEKISSTSKRDYNLIKAAGLLRQLLLDGADSLFFKVNRQYRIPITFTVDGKVASIPKEKLVGIHMLWRPMTPHWPETALVLKLDEFLKYHVYVILDTP
jgi:hypothetical protein